MSLYPLIRDYLLSNLSITTYTYHHTDTNNISIPRYLQKPVNELMKIFHSITNNTASSSIFLYGFRQAGRELVIHYAIQAVFPSSIKIVTVSGLLNDSDESAIFSISKQLNNLSLYKKKEVSEETSYGMVNDPCQTKGSYPEAIANIINHLKIAFIERRPILIIIEDIEQYSKSSKNILIYTLLDLMHKADCFFILISLSSNVLLSTILEKRILSRLNATAIFLPKIQSSDIILDIKNRLLIPHDINFITNRLKKTSMSIVEYESLIEREKNDYDIFKKVFNESVETILGKSNDLRTTQVEGKKSGDQFSVLPVGNRNSIQSEIVRLVGQGCNISEFLGVVLSGLLSLPWSLVHSITQARSELIISEKLFLSMLSSLEPKQLQVTLRSLPLLELQIIAVLAHLELKARDINQDTHSKRKTTATAISIKEVSESFYRLGNISMSFDGTESIIQAICSLQRQKLIRIITPLSQNALSRYAPHKDVNELDCIRLLPPFSARDIQLAFREEGKGGIKISHRIREAVLRPTLSINSTKLHSSDVRKRKAYEMDEGNEISIAYGSRDNHLF